MASSSRQRSAGIDKSTNALIIQPVDGFRSENDKRWFERYFATRTVVVERAADVIALDNFPFKATFERRPEWIQFLLSNVSMCNLSIAREFVSSLIYEGDFKYAAYIRGKSIEFSATTLGNFLGIQPLQSYTLPYRLDTAKPTPSEVRAYITKRNDLEWNGVDKLAVTDLKDPFYKLWMVIANTIAPTTHTSHFDYNRALALYTLGKNEDICLVRYLINLIAGPSIERARNQSIKLGVLITRFCAYMAIRTRPSDALKPQKGVVNNTTWNRSAGQLRGAQEGSDDDEGGEGEEQAEGQEAPVQEAPSRVLGRRRRATSGEPSSTEAPQGSDVAQLLQQMNEQWTTRYEAISNMQQAILTGQTQLANQFAQFVQHIEAQIAAMQTQLQNIQARLPPPPPPQ